MKIPNCLYVLILVTPKFLNGKDRPVHAHTTQVQGGGGAPIISTLPPGLSGVISLTPWPFHLTLKKNLTRKTTEYEETNEHNQTVSDNTRMFLGVLPTLAGTIRTHCDVPQPCNPYYFDISFSFCL
jgi:hypothetical protein